MKIQKIIVLFGFDMVVYPLDNVAVERAKASDVDKFVKRFITRVRDALIDLKYFIRPPKLVAAARKFLLQKLFFQNFRSQISIKFRHTSPALILINLAFLKFRVCMLAYIIYF